MISPDVERTGCQEPRVQWVPEYTSTTGDEAVELAALAGLQLDPWQQLVLRHALGERPDGKWAAFEVGVVVSRQNGKGALLEARELAGLFLLGERLIIHSAHQFDTSLEAFRRLLALIEDHDEFSSLVKRVSRSHGEEGIELKTGQRIRFRTRTKGGGRGFTGDCLILDEAMDLPVSAHGALLPTLSAVPNPQVWYTGSAVDQNVHEHGRVLASIRERGHAGKDPGLAYFEWSVDSTPELVHDVAGDIESWRQANPGLGIRISPSHVELEHRSMAPRTFAVERLGVGDWPTDAAHQGGIAREVWDACRDRDSKITGPLCFAVDVTPDRSSAAICVAGNREDGITHNEVVDHRPGTGWVPDRLLELVERHNAMDGIVLDRGGPAAALLKRLEEASIKVQLVDARELGQACGELYDAVQQQRLRHLGQPMLDAAVRGATQRRLGEAWAWSRRSSAVDISPLVACTLAHWGFTNAESVYEDRGLLVV